MKKLPAGPAELSIGALILTVRGQKVILDAHLARLYGVTTKRLNEQVKRNLRRFPPDFMFRLTKAETEGLRSQFATSNKGRGGRRYTLFAFTEHGALMAANLLNSDRAVEMSVYVIRAFVKMRAELVRTQDLARRLAEIEKMLIGHDAALRDLFAKIRPLLLPALEPKRREIGFEIRERQARYGVNRKRASG